MQICFKCAKGKGWTPKDKAVAHWYADCEVCGQYKVMTAERDWNQKPLEQEYALQLDLMETKEDIP